MVNPVTVNLGIIVPLTGADVDVWGENDVNPNMVALDGIIAGVQTISAGAVPITLTSPAGFVPTPSAGPTQAQNRVLRFTGVLTANVRVTLPLPGSYLIDNRTTGAFVLSFQGVTATEVVGIDQGSIVEIYNDGANVRFVNLGKVGALEFWGGISAIPAWVTACTVKPFLLNDGTVYNFSDYPWLGAKYLAQFGGNGTTTFGVQDLRGRMPLAIDTTGTRVTVATSGMNGAVMGTAGGSAGSQLSTTHLPAYTPSGTVGAGTFASSSSLWATYGTVVGFQGGGTYFGAIVGQGQVTGTTTGGAFTGNAQGGASTLFTNLPLTQVSGIWVVKT